MITTSISKKRKLTQRRGDIVATITVESLGTGSSGICQILRPTVMTQFTGPAVVLLFPLGEVPVCPIGAGHGVLSLGRTIEPWGAGPTQSTSCSSCRGADIYTY